MRTVYLNNTDEEISAVGMGAMHLSLSGRPSETDSIDVLHHAFDLGVRLIDTADSYCIDESDKHHNERLIQKAIDSYDGPTDHILIATKGGLMRPNGAWKRNGDPEHIRDAIQRSYDILNGDDPIDLWQFHAPDSDYPVTESLEPAAEAQESGLINHIGVSNFSVEQIKQAETLLDLVSVQNEYHPWHRAPENNGVLEYCEEHDLTFLPYRPLGGRRRVDQLDDLTAIRQVAERHQSTPQQIVLAWHRSQSSCIVPIPGVSRTKTLQESVASAEVDLAEEEVDSINASL
jgi:aryl-alcohol dehydrogenase-like predicted oxidoreductase